MTAESEYHSNFADVRKIAGHGLSPPEGGSAGQHHLFDRLDWFEALHAGIYGDQQPIAARVKQDQASLWLMLRHDGHCLRSLAYWYSFAWRPLWQGNPDRETKLALCTRAAKDLKHKAAKLALDPVPEEDGSAEILCQALSAAGWTVRREATGHNHWLETRGRSFAEWWAERPGALRSTVKRKANKGLVAIEVHTEFQDRLWDEFEAVYADSWKPPESHPTFLRDWANRESTAGSLRLGIARVDGKAVAAQFWSIDDGVAYIHKLSHISGLDALSPGTLLTHRLFELAFDKDKVERIDFGTGDDGYKRDWMEQSGHLTTIIAWDAKQPAAWPSLAKHCLSRVAARLSGR
jgi:hypothetical protein